LPRSPGWTLAWLGAAVLLGLAWLLASCSGELRHRELGILTEVPCPAPCWQHIVPGETTSSAAVDSVKSLTAVDARTVREGDRMGSGRVSWVWRTPSFLGENRITWENGVVQDIYLVLVDDLPVSDVIAQYGEPEVLRASPCHHAPCYEIGLYFPTIGMDVHGSVSMDNPRIGPHLQVYGVSLYRPMPVEDRFRYLHRHQDDQDAQQSMVRFLDLLRPWEGYGGLRELYYDELPR
jgi:hypothetical protein